MKPNRRRCSPSTANSAAPAIRPVARWQVERARRLHQKFLRAEPALAAGASLRDVFSPFAWYWRTRSYRCDRNRRTQFGFKTLLRLFYVWKARGHTSEALRLNYHRLPPLVPADRLCRFVEFSCQHQFPHMQSAWAEFTKRKGKTGRGRQNTTPLKASYGQIRYYFNGKQFEKLQSAQRAIARAEKHLDELRVQYTTNIRARVPARPRRTGQELSHLGSEL